MSIPAPRYDIALRMRLRPTDSDDSFGGISQNLSESGVLILAERLLPLRSVLRLDFPIFTAKAEVIWTRDVDGDDSVLLGMKFLELSREDRKMLLRVIAGTGTDAG